MSNGSERVRELPTPKPDYEALVEELHAVPHFDTDLSQQAARAVEALVAENEKLRSAENLLAMGAVQMSRATAMSLDQSSAFIEGIHRQATDHKRLRDIEAERDALQAENAELREQWADADALAQVNAMNVADWVAMREERDALRTRLDSMTTEWGIRADDDDEPYTDIYPSLSALADEFDGSLARENEHVVKRRAPGPWTAVVEGDEL